MPQTRQEAEAEFEKLGPGVVQGNLENKVYLQGETGGWARAWLRRRSLTHVAQRHRLDRLRWPDDVAVPTFGHRMVCTGCGIIGAAAMSAARGMKAMSAARGMKKPRWRRGQVATQQTIIATCVGTKRFLFFDWGIPKKKDLRRTFARRSPEFSRMRPREPSSVTSAGNAICRLGLAWLASAPHFPGAGAFSF
jgi:hypothetical protein